jgi:SGNH domain (fused to AT3 domains)
VARCAEREAMGLLTFGAEPHCAIPATRARGLWPEVVEFLDRAESELRVPVVRLTEAMCDETTCHTMENGRSVYRDESHLSYDGSAVIARRARLLTRIRSD